MPTTKPILSVKRLSKRFPIYSDGVVRRVVDNFTAVNDVNFDLMPGETLGIVGESGSGKTTCARCVLRALEPSEGEVIFQSRNGPVDLAQLSEKQLKPLRQEMQMIFQDPFSSLNPRMTVGEIVAEPMLIHKLSKGAALKEQVVSILQKVGLSAEHLNRYPHAFSGGQRQRIGIARALIMKPSLIVADESVSALDVSVQAQVINLLQDLQEEFQLTYIFVAHDLSVVKHICDRVLAMRNGEVVESKTTSELFSNPEHGYTRSLLSAIPSPDPDIPLQPIAYKE